MSAACSRRLWPSPPPWPLTSLLPSAVAAVLPGAQVCRVGTPGRSCRWPAAAAAAAHPAARPLPAACPHSLPARSHLAHPPPPTHPRAQIPLVQLHGAAALRGACGAGGARAVDGVGAGGIRGPGLPAAGLGLGTCVLLSVSVRLCCDCSPMCLHTRPWLRRCRWRGIGEQGRRLSARLSGR